MRKQVFIAFLICLGLFIFSQVFVSRNRTEELYPSPSGSPLLPIITVKDIPVPVTLARTDEEITKGLGGTVHLPDNQGMLFLFNQKDTLRTFWMKNMVIPIDILWVNDGKIVQIDANVPPPESPNVPDSALSKYNSNQFIDYVLETNAGWAEKNGVVVGDIVDLGSLE